MGERLENIGKREELRRRRGIIEAEALSHRDSIRAALPLTGEAEEIDGEYVMSLAISLNEKVQELKGVNRKIAILERELGI